MMLADLGADVVKVERPGEGDETRSWGPPHAGGEAAYFLAVNRSVAVDLKHPEGLALALDLSAAADVVIENFRPGAAARLGLDAAAIHARNSRSSTARSPASADESRSERPGYDFIVQAESGLMAITGEPDAPPTKIGVALVDVLTGLNAAVAILAALRRGDLGGAASGSRSRYSTRRSRHWSTWRKTPSSRARSRRVTATPTRASSRTSRRHVGRLDRRRGGERRPLRAAL
jgi:crotonobetainyl-CoA:carnitine CoA-transferase CaiB-like acyl-CoA transferase